MSVKRNLLQILFSILLIFSLTTPLRAHEWYDPSCCSGEDCKPIESCSEIEELPEGRVKWNGYIFRKDQVKPSKDSKCHICIFRGNPMCAYVQQGS